MTNKLYLSLDEYARKLEALTLKLESADTVIASLKVEIARLENRNIELTVGLENVLSENARLCMVTNHRVESLKVMREGSKPENNSNLHRINTRS